LWLRAKASELQSDHIAVNVKFGPDDGPKPGMMFEIVSSKSLGMFENWITGETDYTIHAPPGGAMVSNKWGLIITDDTFEQIFDEFIAEFRKYDSC
jgi:hypothetical protein